MATPLERPLLDIVTDQILNSEAIPPNLRDLSPTGIEQAKEWIEEQTRKIVSRRPTYTIKDETFDELTGFMLTDNDEYHLVIGQNWPTEIRIATIFHLLGHIKNGSAYDNSLNMSGGIASTYEYMNRRILPMADLKQEFEADDLISNTVLKNPGIAANNSVARALYRSYLPFTQAKPR